MGFVVLHMEKAHGSDSGTTAHIERFIIPKNADPTRTHLNRRLIEYPDGVKDRSAAIQQRLEEAGLTRKIGSNQVRAIRINVSGTHEDMKRIEEEGRLDEWCADNLKYFADTFGRRTSWRRTCIGTRKRRTYTLHSSPSSRESESAGKGRSGRRSDTARNRPTP